MIELVTSMLPEGKSGPSGQNPSPIQSVSRLAESPRSLSAKVTFRRVMSLRSSLPGRDKVTIIPPATEGLGDPPVVERLSGVTVVFPETVEFTILTEPTAQIADPLEAGRPRDSSREKDRSHSGRVAQRKSARFTRERSLVRTQPCPSAPHRKASRSTRR